MLHGVGSVRKFEWLKLVRFRAFKALTKNRSKSGPRSRVGCGWAPVRIELDESPVYGLRGGKWRELEDTVSCCDKRNFRFYRHHRLGKNAEDHVGGWFRAGMLLCTFYWDENRTGTFKQKVSCGFFLFFLFLFWEQRKSNFDVRMEMSRQRPLSSRPEKEVL